MGIDGYPVEISPEETAADEEHDFHLRCTLVGKLDGAVVRNPARKRKEVRSTLARKKNRRDTSITAMYLYKWSYGRT